MLEERLGYGCGYVEMDPTGRYGRFEDVLGRGAMKTVYKAFDEFEGMEVAWNQADVRDVFRSPEAVERLYAEVYLLSSLRHDSIIRFLTHWVDAGKKTFNFITEMFTSGTLREYRQRHKHIDIRAVKNWARQILDGLVYLHGHNPPVIHRDLKCDNIFINGHLGQVGIGDLGLAAVLKGSQKAHSVIGTPEFMAPELYKEEYNELVDVYSFGMCLLEILTGEYPYGECSNPAQIYRKVTTGKLPKAFHLLQDPEAKRFTGLCLEKAAKRPSARELLLDPFLQIEKDTPPSSFQGGFHGGFHGDSLDEDKPVKTDMKITGKLNPDDDAIFLRVQISDKDGHSRNIYFPFDTVNDTPVDVANEMVKELEITDRNPLAIATMIDREISALVPHWKVEVPENCSQHSYSFQEEDGSTHHPFYSSSPSSSQSSCFSPTYSQGHCSFSSRDFLQEDDDDDNGSHISMNSGKYSCASCSSSTKLESGMSSGRKDILVPSHQEQKLKPCVEEARRTTKEAPNVKFHRKGKMPFEPPPTSNRLEKMSHLDRRLLRHRSQVNLRSQLLHQRLVEEVNKRHFKTVGAVENIGFQNPYQTSSKGRRASHIHGPIKNLGFTWGNG